MDSLSAQTRSSFLMIVRRYYVARVEVFLTVVYSFLYHLHSLTQTALMHENIILCPISQNASY